MKKKTKWGVDWISPHRRILSQAAMKACESTGSTAV